MRDERRRICGGKPLAQRSEKYLTLEDYAAWDARSPCWPRPHFLPHVVDRYPITGGFFESSTSSAPP